MRLWATARQQQGALFLGQARGPNRINCTLQTAWQNAINGAPMVIDSKTAILALKAGGS